MAVRPWWQFSATVRGWRSGSTIRCMRPATTRLLRDLRHWPRLCFVDCSPSGDRLAPLLAPFGLEVMALEEVSHWLGGIATGLPGAAPLGAGTLR